MESPTSEGGVFFGRAGLGSLGGPSATKVVSWQKKAGTIVSSTPENGGMKMMDPVGVPVEGGCRDFVGVGVGTLETVSATIRASWQGKNGDIVYGIVDNRSVEKMG